MTAPPYRMLAGVLLVTLLALALRLAAIDRHLPHSPEPDTHMVTHLIARAQGYDPVERDPQTLFYSRLIPEVVLHVPGLTILEQPEPGAPLAKHLAAASRPYLIVRLISAVMGGLLPLVIFFLARRLLGDRGALLAALFVATSLLHLRYSLQARPHITHVTLIWIALSVLAHLVERPSTRRALAAGLSVFLAVGSLQSGLLLAPAILAASYLAGRGARRLATAGILIFAFILAVATCYPGFRFAGLGVELGPGARPIALDKMNGGGAVLTFRFLWEEDPVLLGLAILGIAAAARSLLRGLAPGFDRRRALVLAGFVVPHALISLLNAETEARYLLPAIPWMAAAAALGVETLARASIPLLKSPTRYLLFATASILLPLAIAARFVQVVLALDTYEQAAQWLPSQSVTGERRILLPTGLVLPLLSQREATSRKARYLWPWIEYQALEQPNPIERFDLSWLRTDRGSPSDAKDIARLLEIERINWVVVANSERWRHLPVSRTLNTVCLERGERAAVFQGNRSESIDYDNTRWLAWRLFGAQAFGPRIEIYRIAQPQ